MNSISWHSLSIEKILEIQKTDLDWGLTEIEVNSRQKKFGKNDLPEKKQATKLAIFFSQFKNPLILILVFAGLVLAFFLRELIDALAIFIVVFTNAFVGFFQEYKATKIFEKLKKVLEIEARVIREGKEKIINAKELVPGDIVILSAGQKVPADGRIFFAQDLKIEEAILTGEFLPSTKDEKALPPDTPLADRENMAYFGTLVIEGKGKMIVTETGKNTEIGKISQDIEEIQKKTPLQKKIKTLSFELALFLLSIVFVVFLSGAIRGL
ncbi:HAD-IC family P-type ATPase, partial [Candidatus Parcubacteria bacterium]|nr:HAD-IC family P-type ATPase [Candidatus Parcubacteria bacterium]